MKCKTCKNEISRGTRVCPFCGSKVKIESKKVIITCLIILIFALVGIMAFLKITMLLSPKNVFDTAIDKIFDSIILDNFYNITTDINMYSIDTGNKTKDEEFKIIEDLISDLYLKLNIQIDAENNKNYLKVDLKQNDKNLLFLDSFIDNNKLYLYNQDYYDYPVEIDLEEHNSVIKDIDISKAKNILNILKNEIKNQIDVKDLFKEKTTINIENTEVNVNKYSMALSGKNLKSKIEIISNNLLDYMDSIEDKKDFLPSIQYILNELIVEEDIYVFSIYLEGFELKERRIEVESLINTLVQFDVLSDNEYKIKFAGYEDINEIYIKKSGNTFEYSFIYNKIPNKKWVISITSTFNTMIKENFTTENAVKYEDLDVNQLPNILSNIELYNIVVEYLSSMIMENMNLDENAIKLLSDNRSSIEIDDNRIIEFDIPINFEEANDLSINNNKLKNYYDEHNEIISISVKNISMNEFKNKIKDRVESYREHNAKLSICNGEQNDISYIITYEEDDEILKEEYITLEIDNDKIFVVEAKNAINIVENDLLVFIENTEVKNKFEVDE